MANIPQFNPESFFKYAGSILNNATANEAELRSAISRVYYSIFLVARDRLFGLDGKQLTKGVEKKLLKNYQIRISKKKKALGSHEKIIYAIRDKTNNITLYQQIDQLREARVNADYILNQHILVDLNKRNWREYAEENMQLATLVLPRVRQLPSY